MNPSRDDQIDRLLSKDAIRDLVVQYCIGVDRGDIALLEQLYEPDGIDEHGYNLTDTAREFLDSIAGLQTQIHALQHNVTNHMIHVAGDEAEGEVHIIAYHRFDTADGPAMLITGGRYLDRYHRREGVWRIAHRKCVDDWSHQFPVPSGDGQKDFTDGRLAKGRIGPDDPAYPFFRLSRRGERS
jgi:hypothetical protein